MNVTTEQLRDVWKLMSPGEKGEVREKAEWERCTVFSALKEWFPALISKYLEILARGREVGLIRSEVQT